MYNFPWESRHIIVLMTFWYHWSLFRSFSSVSLIPTPYRTCIFWFFPQALVGFTIFAKKLFHGIRKETKQTAVSLEFRLFLGKKVCTFCQFCQTCTIISLRSVSFRENYSFVKHGIPRNGHFFRVITKFVSLPFRVSRLERNFMRNPRAHPDLQIRLQGKCTLRMSSSAK